MHSMVCSVHGEVALCEDCSKGPCRIALMPGEACHQEDGPNAWCMCHGLCEAETLAVQ